MTDHDINRVLAEFMGVDWDKYLHRCFEDHQPIDAQYDYCNNRNDLADVLAKLTPEQWERSLEYIARSFPQEIQDNPPSDQEQMRMLLTCDPRIITQAVAEVVAQSKM